MHRENFLKLFMWIKDGRQKARRMHLDPNPHLKTSSDFFFFFLLFFYFQVFTGLRSVDPTHIFSSCFYGKSSSFCRHFRGFKGDIASLLPGLQAVCIMQIYDTVRCHKVTEFKVGLLTRRFRSSVFCGREEHQQTLGLLTFKFFACTTHWRERKKTWKSITDLLLKNVEAVWGLSWGGPVGRKIPLFSVWNALLTHVWSLHVDAETKAHIMVTLVACVEGCSEQNLPLKAALSHISFPTEVNKQTITARFQG